MKFLSILLLTALFIFSTALLAAPADTALTGIKFEHGSWQEIITKAKQENKPVFLDAFASWCGPCKWMAKNIFPNDTVGEFYNKNFICAKIDMEKGEGIDIAKKFGVRAYPTFLYISPDGESLLHRTCGSTTADIFLQNGKNALDPEKQLLAYKKKFENSTPDAKEAYKYLQMLSDACMDNEQDLSVYFKTQKESELISADNWKIIFSFLSDPNSPVFSYLLSHKKEFEKVYNPELVNNKIADIYSAGLLKALRKEDIKAYDNLKKEIVKSAIPDGEKVILKTDLTKYQRAKDWKNYAKTADIFVTKYRGNDPTLLNKISWTIYENVNDKSILQKAEKWSKHAAELENNYSFNDTHAAVLYKLGRKAEAKDAALKAIDLAKKEGADFKETEELLAKINDMK